MPRERDNAPFELYPPTDEVQQKLPQVGFIVEATAFERDSLYLQYRESAAWVDGLTTRLLTIGQIYGRDICIKVSIPFVEGVQVLFIEPASELFDHKVLAAWLDRYCNPMYVGENRKARTDARNFRDCVRALREIKNDPSRLACA